MTHPPDWSPLEEPPPGAQPWPPAPPAPAGPQVPPAPAGPPVAPQPPGYSAPPQWGQPPAPPGYGTVPPYVPPGAPPAPPGQGYGTPGYGTPGYGTPGYGTPAALAAPRPGIVPLRPITLGEIFDGAFQAIRTNPRTMIGFSAVVLALTTVVSVVPQALLLTGLADSAVLDPAGQPSAEDAVAFVGSMVTALLVPALLQFLVLTVLNALLVVAVSDAVLGRKMAPGELWRRVRGRVLAVLGLTLVTVVAATAVMVVLLVPGIALLAADQTAAGVGLVLLGVLGCVVVLVLLWVRWAVAGPALLLEGQGVFGSLRRSWRLLRGSFWRALGILLLTQIVVGVGSSIIGVPFSLFGTLLGSTSENPYSSLSLTLGQLLVSNVGTVLAGAVFYPFASAVTALLYVDLRMRREGLDVQLLQASEAGTPR